MNWTFAVVVVVVVVNLQKATILFSSIRRYVVSLFVVNTGRTTGFPPQQYQTPTLSGMLEYKFRQ